MHRSQDRRCSLSIRFLNETYIQDCIRNRANTFPTTSVTLALPTTVPPIIYQRSSPAASSSGSSGSRNCKLPPPQSSDKDDIGQKWVTKALGAMMLKQSCSNGKTDQLKRPHGKCSVSCAGTDPSRDDRSSLKLQVGMNHPHEA